MSSLFSSTPSASKPLSLVLPATYKYHLLLLILLCYLIIAQTGLITIHRKRSGIKYPQVYAELKELEEEKKKGKNDKLLFNCMQRIHANTLENVPLFILGLFLSSLSFPNASLALGSGWLFSRVLYTIGYATGTPSNRIPGALIGSATLLSLLITGGVSVVKLL